MTKRLQLTDDDFADAVFAVNEALRARIKQKGYGCLASTHEALGILQEEHHELVEAVHQSGGHDQVVHELEDIAVGCIFAIASIEAGGMDW